MIPALTKKLAKIAKTTSVKHVLFTGHSAGGAVASLMFAKLLSHMEKECE
jgi:putative lipase involved disintegration of autophagic bodies